MEPAAHAYDKPDHTELIQAIAQEMEGRCMSGNREVFRRLIEGWGGSVAEACSATSALKMMGDSSEPECRFDVVIADHHMPGISGLEFAGLLRQHPHGKSLPLILATSDPTHNLSEEAQAFSIDLILLKPIHEQTLLNVLLAALHPEGTRTAHRPSSQQNTGEGRESRRVRVLVAEDNTINQQIAVRLLAKLGYRVDVANDGGESVEMIKVCDYDLVLMDIQMPGIDGLAATAMIRALPGPKSKVRIIAMTAHAMQGDREECLSAGMDDYISKPVSRDKLVEMLNHWSRQKQPV